MIASNCGLHNLHRMPRISNRHIVNTFCRQFTNCSLMPRSTLSLHRLKQHAKSGRLGVCGVLQTRNNSTVATNTDTASATKQLATDLPPGYIPEPPVIPQDQVSEAVLNSIGEVPLAELGLCNYTPAGLVQWGLENIHVGLDIPWWGAIAVGTLILRLCLFPLVIKSQKQTINLQNHMPTIKRLQERMTQARMEGNQVKAMQITHEMQEYMIRNKVNPFRSLTLPLCQVPIFLSVFTGLRAMANLPVESMTTGGLFWFTDLTLADPLHLLPFITSATLLATLEIGSDGVSTQTLTSKMKWGMRGLSIVMIPFMWKFPAAILCYWFTANFFSMIQVTFLKTPRIRRFFDLPVAVKHKQPEKQTKKSFTEGFRDSMDNVKMLNRIENQRQADAISFRQAGQAPLKKTYSYNPKTVNKARAQAKQN